MSYATVYDLMKHLTTPCVLPNQAAREWLRTMESLVTGGAYAPRFPVPAQWEFMLEKMRKTEGDRWLTHWQELARMESLMNGFWTDSAHLQDAGLHSVSNRAFFHPDTCATCGQPKFHHAEQYCLWHPGGRYVARYRKP